MNSLIDISPKMKLPLTFERLATWREHMSVKTIADELGVSEQLVQKWEKHDFPLPLFPITHLLESKQEQFTFIDLFAGIGGMRLGFERAGGQCVFTSEWNTFSQKTYQTNFLMNHELVGDIVPYPADQIPNHDILVAGFPCQPFSIAGVSKKNSLGKAHGFECTTQGTLFFDVARIIATKQPKAFLLENVKNLVSHDQGRTFQIILQTLRDELGYNVQYRVLDGGKFTPQHRERIIIIGFKDVNNFDFSALKLPTEPHTLTQILHSENGNEQPEAEYTLGSKASVNQKYILSKKLWQYLQDYAQKHREKGNGFGFGLVTPKDTARTLSARYYKDGSEILVARAKGNPRRLTPRECARLMGFPDSFQIPVSDTQAYKQFGNSVVVPLIETVAKFIKPFVVTPEIRDFQ